MLKSTVF